MPPRDLNQSVAQAIKTAEALTGALENLTAEDLALAASASLLSSAERARDALDRTLRAIAPARYGEIGITLGRSDSIAKFFAFSFAVTAKVPLTDLEKRPFWGSGVYAIYYRGKSESAYVPLAGTETPIYVGKADPVDPFAGSLDAQGRTLWKRLREHAKNISKAENLKLDDFEYRAATVQSGMQAAVEEFMIRLFRPIWNKNVGVSHGLGKHGDSSKTRANKRSPWDTMHPGRGWAKDTLRNQSERHEIEAKIKAHFQSYPIIKDRKQLFEHLALVAEPLGASS